MTHVTCRLTAKNRDQLRNPALGSRVWATFFYLLLWKLGPIGSVRARFARLQTSWERADISAAVTSGALWSITATTKTVFSQFPTKSISLSRLPVNPPAPCQNGPGNVVKSLFSSARICNSLKRQLSNATVYKVHTRIDTIKCCGDKPDSFSVAVYTVRQKKEPLFFCVHLSWYLTEIGEFFVYIKERRSNSSVHLILARAKNFVW